MRLPAAALSVLLFLSGIAAMGQVAIGQGPLVLQGGRVYPSPTGSPIDNAAVVMEGGKIVAVGVSGVVKTPKGARVIDCKGKVTVAGFWNSHVHFESGWEDVPHTSPERLEAHMQEMLTRWGVTTVWDLGSAPENTLELRHRIAAGEIGGPQILMAGDIFPLNGHPVYLPAEMKLPEAASPEQSERMAQGYLKMGLDGIKLFTGAYMGDKPVVNMDTAIVKAAVDVAHAQGRPVFAHPQNREGQDNALAGGVDVLAHTIPNEGRYTAEELARMKQQHTALIPTLTLWTTVVSDPAVTKMLVDAGVAELKQYFSEGGPILFGTDVGFQSKYDTSQEYELMGRAMGWRDILASLTTNPSGYFKDATKGRVEQGMQADVVVLDADPAGDVHRFSQVAYTIRGGKIIYSASGRVQ
ncbi:amidohydrolase family protein [Granulicella sp. L60]|uniref:amidohydrolase family protein n=1 Tax=Granulicella sp. L60 TaxID=1641866 RepID=UPI00131D4597|nr:amidohydrolase family protein [Granulicella sp. L60]